MRLPFLVLCALLAPALAVPALPAPPLFPGTVLFEDGFEEGLEGWENPHAAATQVCDAEGCRLRLAGTVQAGYVRAAHAVDDPGQGAVVATVLFRGKSLTGHTDASFHLQMDRGRVYLHFTEGTPENNGLRFSTEGLQEPLVRENPAYDLLPPSLPLGLDWLRQVVTLPRHVDVTQFPLASAWTEVDAWYVFRLHVDPRSHLAFATVTSPDGKDTHFGPLPIAREATRVTSVGWTAVNWACTCNGESWDFDDLRVEAFG